ncbi:uncharacterized protein VP01_1817g1 [Puccinia sorghi]|uniref:Uncharacterized protein n=1 Tax=Puccinia sorghi TaxID=27349 RepID=A0A0L6VEN1_9BASI|nr:uncharacterized protein VP01_1817g1 [Puccinia sorghi]
MSEDPFGSTRRRPAPPRLRLSNVSRPPRSSATDPADSKPPLSARSEPGASISSALSEPPFLHSGYNVFSSRTRTPHDEDAFLFSHQPTSTPAHIYSPSRTNMPSELDPNQAPENLIDQLNQASQTNSNNYPYLNSKHIPPVPPLPPHLAHLNGNPQLSASQSLSTHLYSSLTPQALLQRLEQLLQAKSHEIQLAGQLGSSLLEQQAELEMRISELESTGALLSVSHPKPKRRDRERTPATPNKYDSQDLEPDSHSGESSQASEDEANLLDETVRRKVEELDAAMKRWQEGNSEIWRQARGEASTISRPSTPSQSPNGTMPVTPLGLQLPPASTPYSSDLKSTPGNQQCPPTDQSVNRRARNAQHRANDIEFATEIGQSLLGEVRRLQSLLVVKEDELMEMKEEREGLWERNEHLMQRIKDYETSVDRFKDENWNLELSKQELQTQLTSTNDEKVKVEADRLKLIKQLSDLQQSSDQQRTEIERITNLLGEERNKYEITIATQRKNHAGLQRENSDIQGVLDGLKAELEAMKKKVALKRVVGGVPGNATSDDTSNPTGGDEQEILTTRMTPGKRKPGDYLHRNGTPIDGFGFGDDGDPENHNGTPARQRGLGSNLGFSTENDQLRTSLAHAQRTISTLRGALQRKKEDALRAKKSSAVSLGDAVKASDMLVRDDGDDDDDDDDDDNDDNHPENQLPRKLLLGSSVRGTPRSGSRGRTRGGLPSRRGRFRDPPIYSAPFKPSRR